MATSVKSRAGKQTRNATPTEEKSSGLPRGTTDDGTEFLVPATTNTLEQFHPRNWNALSVFTMSLVLVNLWLTVYGHMPVSFHICVFAFWRINYNVALGLILNAQSRRRAVTRVYERLYHSKDKGSVQRLMWRFARHLAGSGVKGGHNPDEFPIPFNAWLAFRHGVDLILVNDSSSYLLLGYKLFHWPGLEHMVWYDWLVYVVGVFLAYFNYTAKVDAHRCIGDYSWYWGDFFFRKHAELTFDGIFELFPHPMYTVGYSLYYGYSLLCRSYTLLFVSMGAHMLQMGFLMWVEEPHIKRTYGEGKPELDKAEYRFMYDPKSGIFPGKRESVFLTHLDAFYTGDVSLLALLLYALAFTITMETHWLVIQVVVWRLFHWGGLGYVLWAQSRRQMYTRHFTDRGRTLYEAFDNWKKTYNLCHTMNAAVFLGCALRFASETYTSWEIVFMLDNLACISVGVLLSCLSLWTLSSMYEHIGDFGWFYGDFFIPADRHKHHLSYTGVYRFLNNPDCVVGHAGLYGLALIAQNWTVFWLAALGQVLNILFVMYVEIPHTKRLYKSEVRKMGPLSRKFREKVSDVISSPMEEQIRRDARKIRQKAVRQIYKLYSRLRPRSVSAGSKSTGSARLSIEADRHLRVGQPLTVQYVTNADHSDTDWIGIYPAELDSVPGQSGGLWLYVPHEATGQVVFDYPVLPKTAGVYEIRYHRNNSYVVECAVPICLHDCDTDEEDDLLHQE